MRLSWLDFLRFLAATAVFLQHLLETLDAQRFRPFLSLGPGVFGVVLFFLVSGYVIPFSVRRGFSPTEFAVRRLFRIFPAYLTVLGILVCLGLAGLAPWRAILGADGPAGLIANALLVQDYTGHAALLGVSWTLSLEIVWYAGFAFSLLVFGGRHVHLISLAGSAGLAALAVAALMIEVRIPLGRIGMLNAALFGYAACRADQGRLGPKAFYIALGAFLAAVTLSQWIAFGHFHHARVTLSSDLTGWLAAAAVFIAFHGIRAVRESRLAVSPLAARLGAISYPIYLVHAPLIALWFQWFGASLALLAVPALTLALSLLLHRHVEVPGMALGRRATPGVGRQPAVRLETHR